MNRLKLWIIAALATALALSAIGGASAQGWPPLVFTGTVTDVDGNPAATGLTVQAYIGDTDCTTSNTGSTWQRADGKTYYWAFVTRSWQKPGCGDDGDKVRFKIGSKWATQTGTFSSAAKTTLNLTLTDASDPVTIQVAVWRRISDQVLAISTRAPDGGWVTHRGWPLDMSQVSGSGIWNRSEITPVQVTLSTGSTVTIEVAVWRRISDQVLAISTRAPGGGWVTHTGWPLDMSQVSGSGIWNRSEITPVTVNLQ